MKASQRSQKDFRDRAFPPLGPFTNGAIAPPLIHHDGICAPVQTEIIETAERLELLRAAWNDLLQNSRSNNMFLTWEWVYSWWKNLAEKRRLRVIAIRRESRLICVAPLALEPAQPGRFLPFRRLTFAGMNTVGTDYPDCIVRNGEEAIAMDALADYLANQNFMLELKRVTEDSTVASGLASRLKKKGWGIVTTVSDTCPYIRLRGHSWESYLASLGPSHRRNLRKRLHRIEKVFAPRLEEAHTEPERKEYLRQFIQLHHKRWNGPQGSDAINRDSVIRFHEDFSRLALQRGWLRLSVLHLNDQPAAATYGFRYGGVFYYYQAGFDPEFANYSIGLAALGLSIRTEIAQGIHEYDLLHGSDSYKFLWTRDKRTLLTLRCYPPGAHGAASRRLERLRDQTKLLVHRSEAALNLAHGRPLLERAES